MKGQGPRGGWLRSVSELSDSVPPNCRDSRELLRGVKKGGREAPADED